MSIKKQGENEKKFETKWDEAIADAKDKIKGLRYSISVYRQRKLAGDTWPGGQEARHA